MSRKRRSNEFPDNGFEMWGGYMNAKIAKLEEQFQEHAEKGEESISSLFFGISIFVNGHTNPPASELKSSMAKHGGIYHHYFRSGKTKFIIASNLANTKIKNLPTTKIVKPEWISDSIKAGILLDYKEYLLYSNHSKSQPRLNFKNTNSSTIGLDSNHTVGDLASENDESTSSKLSVQESSEKCLKESIPVNNLERETVQDVNVPETVQDVNVSETVQDENIPETVQEINVSENTMCGPKQKRKSSMSAVNPDFLTEFYSNSRLHHISQLGFGFKKFINDLRSESDFNFPMRNSIRKPKLSSVSQTLVAEDLSTVIMHIDMDCFFVSVGLCEYPHLIGKPVVVTHSKGGSSSHHNNSADRQSEFQMHKERKKKRVLKATAKQTGGTIEQDVVIKSRVDDLSFDDGKFGSMSEIASCSYEARAFGIHNGMFMGPALKLCPHLKTIPYDFQAYKEVAFTLYKTVAEYTLDIEAVSCDEMYVDCTELLKNLNMSAMEFATILREQIKEKTKCSCSTGFGENKLQARMATKKAKPNGQYLLKKSDVHDYFTSIALGDLPGIGYQTENKLVTLGFKDCGSLRNANLDLLKKHFGEKTGLVLYNFCRGIDDRPLFYTTVRKSISAGANYGIRFEDNKQAETFVKQLSSEVCSRMHQNNVIGKSITLKLMVRAANAPVETSKFMGHGFCDNITKTKKLTQATDNVDTITKAVFELYKKISKKPEDMRGISIQISKLEDNSPKIKKAGIEGFLSEKNRDTKQINQNVKSSTINIKNTSPVIDSNLKNTFDEKQSESTKQNKGKVKPKSPPVKRTKSLGLTSRRRVSPRLPQPNISKMDANKKISELLSNKPVEDFNNCSQIDEEFLKALPDDIKQEVLTNYKVKHKRKSLQNSPKNLMTTNNSKIDPDYLSALPEELRKEIETHIETYGVESCIPNNTILNKQSLQATESLRDDKLNSEVKTDIERNASFEEANESYESETNLMELDWRKMRSMLKSWFESTEEPLQCDIEMISSYLRALIHRKNIQDLYYTMNFLYRVLNENYTCKWHQVYLEIEKNIQETMLQVYENQLFTNKTFSCCANTS